MSYFDYIAFPRELKVLHFSDIKGREKEYGINYDTTNFRKDILLFPESPDESHIVLCDKKEATFNGCFKNQFIYEYHVYLSNEYHKRRSNILFGNLSLDEETKNKILEKFLNDDWLLYKQVQHDFIIQHLNTGEFAEIYTEQTNHVNFNLGPPESECTMNLEEFLNLPLYTEIYNKMYSNKNKTTIYKL